jgi:hypothetical protein
MSLLYGIVALLTILVLVYLVLGLLFPERFS